MATAMDTVMVSRRSPVRRAGFLLLLTAIKSGAAHADTLTITPRFSTSETYTDNLTLAPSNEATPGFITQLTPGINIKDNGSQLKLNIDYSLLDMIYNNYGWEHTYYNQLNATGDLELIKKTFFIDASSTISQQPLSLFGPVSANGANLTGNVANVTTETISPTLVHNFDEEFIAQAKLTRSLMNFSAAGPAVYGGAGGFSPYQVGLTPGYDFSGSSNIADMYVTNGAEFTNFLWKLDYNNNQTVFTGYPNSTISLLTADLGYLITPRFKLTSEVGYENDNFVYFGPRPQGLFWNVGYGWSPSQRTHLDMSAGERFYGRTYLLNLSHRMRHVMIQAGYNQSVMSSMGEQYLPPATALDQLLLTQITDPAQRQQTIQQILSALGPQSSLFGMNVITNEIFLSKTFQSSVGVTTTRNTVLFTLFDSQTLPLQQPGASSLNNPFLQFQNYLAFGTFYTSGATLTWSNQLTPVMTATFSDTYSRMSMANLAGQETTDLLLIGVSDKLTEKVTSSLTYRHQYMNGGVVGGYNFMENALIAGLNFIF
ncbi:TIGR03016 family PEP-CTERM system-associated outer membrane protein [Ferrovum myxofaciens]|uniref:TIGR03016 family PEP-CTERM system-associated outer membrane protein n=4 Tax=root TaxID=1 RepID=A0A9E6MW01_9PROT|nr:TIGR03016 family PEP-CTERM system-associated outer membrane protein [Ferrovum myxofaciens]QKE39217.2 MAG: TIGR03016 family PEP-CTERM system-associated outer membrane protein [Ferrovum myxofaciens]QWY74472.1 MAG: TIGR03016 family PEP-CTERM system-associated outer membrane protein [Ferrovum myxofaciens]QWY77219.1 MAG: TIGR03016 family PEP-CTERM system-associated outer membrane protein [Ferrovum myxofaciens]